MQEQLKKRAEEVFGFALEIESVEQRKTYLNHACRRNARLRAVVDEMLVLQPVVGRFVADVEVAYLLAEAEVRRGSRSAE